MGREINETVEDVDEDEEDEDEEFDFPADADADAWEDPSPDGVLGTLFEACVSHDSATVLPLLPRAGEFINTLGPEGDTLLHTAALYGHADLVEALLAAGADPAVKDENSSTPLHDASAGGYLAIVTQLLAACPQLVHELDDDAELALHCAARGGFPEVVAALLAAGSDKTKENCEGATPLQLAEDRATAELLA